jgi:hypothetical protein
MPHHLIQSKRRLRRGGNRRQNGQEESHVLIFSLRVSAMAK